MCLAIEALLGRPGVGGAGFEHNVIVGAEGCEVITAACPARWWE
jgi:Xaa-Pro aminopeptidase